MVVVAVARCRKKEEYGRRQEKRAPGYKQQDQDQSLLSTGLLQRGTYSRQDAHPAPEKGRGLENVKGSENWDIPSSSSEDCSFCSCLPGVMYFGAGSPSRMHR